jgi:hypothetical protein
MGFVTKYYKAQSLFCIGGLKNIHSRTSYTIYYTRGILQKVKENLPHEIVTRNPTSKVLPARK